MRISRLKLHGVCLALALSSLAGCDNKELPAAPAAPKTVAELPPTDLRVQALNKAKSLTPDDRRALLADARWAKETAAYGELMKKAVVASDKLSDKDTLALGDKMYKAHTALMQAAGREHTQVMYLLRAETVGTKAELTELGKFSAKLRSIRSANQAGNPIAEQRRQAYVERAKARQAEHAKLPPSAELGTAAPASTTPASPATVPSAPATKP